MIRRRPLIRMNERNRKWTKYFLIAFSAIISAVTSLVLLYTICIMSGAALFGDEGGFVGGVVATFLVIAGVCAVAIANDMEKHS